jgi:hypothetical protein
MSASRAGCIWQLAESVPELPGAGAPHLDFEMWVHFNRCPALDTTHIIKEGPKRPAACPELAERVVPGPSRRLDSEPDLESAAAQGEQRGEMGM